jgi:RNA recognition motif-containing protein
LPKLFVGNIPHASSDGELREWVEARGFPVKAAEIIHDRSTGQSRGFGFVALVDEGKAKEAILALNGGRMGGRILTVNEAVPRTPRVNRETQHAGRFNSYEKHYRDRKAS